MSEQPAKELPPVNHEMVTLARESRGLLQSQAAKLLGLYQGRLSKIESGLTSADEDIRRKLSAVLCYPPEFFSLKNSVFGPGTSEFFHRKLQSTPARKLRQIHAEINIRIIHIERLLRAIDIEKDNIPRIDLEERRWSVSDVARAVRATWNLPPGPVQTVVNSIEAAGGLVIPCKFDCVNIDALSRYIPGLPHLFFVDDSLLGDRLRMTLAHELGHAVLHRLPNPDMEDQAFQFAAEFLMPEKEIRPQFDQVTLAKLGTMKQVWKVSMAALLKRAGDLGKISPDMKRYLWTKMSKSGYRTREPAEFDVPIEEPRMLKQIIEVHQNDLGYGLGDLSKLLFLDKEEAQLKYNIVPSKTESKLRLRAI